MDLESIEQSVDAIRSAIKVAREQNQNAQLMPNFEGGLRKCDELLAIAQAATERLSYRELMGRFEYYVSDSLPWTDDLLDTLNREKKSIRVALRQPS